MHKISAEARQILREFAQHYKAGRYTRTNFTLPISPERRAAREELEAAHLIEWAHGGPASWRLTELGHELVKEMLAGGAGELIGEPGAPPLK